MPGDPRKLRRSECIRIQIFKRYDAGPGHTLGLEAGAQTTSNCSLELLLPPVSKRPREDTIVHLEDHNDAARLAILIFVPGKTNVGHFADTDSAEFNSRTHGQAADITRHIGFKQSLLFEGAPSAECKNSRYQ